MSERADALRPLPSRAVTIRPRLATPSARPATAPPSKEMTMTGTSHPGPLTPPAAPASPAARAPAAAGMR